MCVSPLAEMPQEAWRQHLNWLSGSLQRLTEEEEEEGDEDNSIRSRLESGERFPERKC